VTVVATGYEGQRRAERRSFDEPAGEPRVERRPRAAERERPQRRVGELDVPEFIPRG